MLKYYLDLVCKINIIFIFAIKLFLNKLYQNYINYVFLIDMFKPYILVLSTAIQLNLDGKPNDPIYCNCFLKNLYLTYCYFSLDEIYVYK